MKSSVSAIIFLFLQIVVLRSQPCTPNPDAVVDGYFGIFPLAFSEEERPEGGITDTAILNEDFEFTFTVKISDMVEFNGITLQVQNLSIATSGAFTYDPGVANFGYVCDPPNCVFPPNQLGCLKIYGKATDPAALGRHEVSLSAVVGTQFGPVPISFPSSVTSGNYYLFIKNCLANLSLVQPSIASNTYQASNQIIASGAVESGSSVIFRAGNQIQLVSGFTAKTGSEFLSLIEDCVTPPATASKIIRD
jgi:hypothetical protein